MHIKECGILSYLLGKKEILVWHRVTWNATSHYILGDTGVVNASLGSTLLLVNTIMDHSLYKLDNAIFM